MSIFRCRWQRRLDWRAGRKFSGNCWSGVNYAWCDLRFQPSAKIGRSQRSVKVGFDTLSWASHPSESGNSPLKSGLSLHLLAGHHEIIGLEHRTPTPKVLRHSTAKRCSRNTRMDADTSLGSSVFPTAWLPNVNEIVGGFPSRARCAEEGGTEVRMQSANHDGLAARPPHGDLGELSAFMATIGVPLRGDGITGSLSV